MTATCSLRSCGQPLREDTDFLMAADYYNLPTRRFVCPAGHSSYTGKVDVTQGKARGSWGAAVERRICPACGNWFLPRHNARVFCHVPCTGPPPKRRPA